ncbi:transcriptional regulator [Microvirga roseola]|uniref:transcriptional regulator n=1 Tax=Microvirga roseola TaxID=2883126 RepID=UPI001E32F9F8|nr:transcriptional regulator [Microvirga roseola]
MSQTARMEALINIRTALGLSQAGMAYQLEMTIREYQALEWGEREVPNVYLWAAERLAMGQAVHEKDPRIAPAAIRQEALMLARMSGAG